MNKKIETENLILIPCDQEILGYAIDGNQELERHLKIVVPEKWTEFGPRALKYSLERLNSNETEQGWWTYLPIHRRENKLIGSCGYKGKPKDDGSVEIGYEISPDYRNKGFATELANALVINAFKYESVNGVQAHTLGEVNASTKVLTKCGFKKIEEIIDKDHGVLWKWEIKKAK